MTRRRFAILAAALALTSCKRQRAPKVAEIWDEDPAPGAAEAIGNLAPPWPAPTRAMLDNGLLTFWLHEENAPTLHVRVLVPTSARQEALSPAAATVSTEYVRYELQRRLGRSGMSVDVRHGPGRVEFAAHGGVDNVEGTLRAVATVFGRTRPTAGLEAARKRIVDGLDTPFSDEMAVTELAGQLVGQSPELVTEPDVRGVGKTRLAEEFERFADPRYAVVVVHAGQEAKSARPFLRQMTGSWRGLGRRDFAKSAVSRLRHAKKISGNGLRLLSDPPAPLLFLDRPARGGPVMVIARVIDTSSPTSRSYARLAQRVLQEEVDARIAISGERTLFIMRATLSARDPGKSAERAVDSLSDLAQTRHQRQRLFQAAQLWLGARVVQASLNGEDWTSLWAEAVDLADEDADIPGALGRDAQAMLNPDPEHFLEWQKRWLDPRSGEPGWTWMVAGADKKSARRLGRLGTVTEVR